MARHVGADIRAFGLSEEDLRSLGFRRRSEPEEPRQPDHRPASARQGDRAWVGWLAMAAVLALTAWAASPQRRIPGAVSAAAPSTVFSSARAMAQLVEMTRQPHAIGSPGHEGNRELLVARLRAMGLEPQLQTTTAAVADSATVRAATVRNVIARLPGSASTGAVALVAHYDAAPQSPGASDDAFDVAAVLEATRAVVAGGSTRNDVIIVLTDGGEVDGLGARAFVEEHPWAADVAIVVAVEARGGEGPAISVAATSEAGLPLDPGSGAGPGATSLSQALLGGAGRHGGLAPFLDRGSKGLFISTIGSPARRHQPTDVAAAVREETLQDVGQQLVALTRALSDADLALLAGVQTPPMAYFTVPFIGLVQYPQGRGLVIELGLIGAWALMGVLLHLRGALGRGTVTGVVVSLTAVAGSVGLADALFDFLRDRHTEFGMLESAFYADGPHVGALAALALALVSATYAVARRWFRVEELLVGALVVPLAFSGWVAVTAPTAAAAVQWPLAIALFATGLLMFVGPRHRGRAWTRALLVLLSGGFLLLAVPSLELLASAWTFREAASLGAVFALTALGLLPVLDAMATPRGWMTPTLGVAVAGALVAVALPAVQGADDHPVPTTLVYLTDEPVESRLPLGPLDSAQSEVRRMDGRWLTVPGIGERWARSWVADPPTGATDPGIVLLAPEWEYEVAGTGPEAELAPPRARLVEDVVEGGRRRLRIGVTSGLRGEMLGLQLGQGAAFAKVGGVPLTDASLAATTLTHWGRPPDDELLVDVTLPLESSALELIVVEHHLRPRDVLGEHVFQRADSLIANAAADSDRVIQRTVIRLAAVDVANPAADR